MKKGFTLVELLVSITIIGILASIGLSTFTSAQMKSRDAKRKVHLKQLADSFEAYYNDYGQYPDDGKIDWGAQFSDDKGTVYMVKLPADPTQGLNYDYLPEATARKSFQIYARLENTKDIDIPKNAQGASLIYTDAAVNCGTLKCNYGKSSGNVSVSDGRTINYE